ncbi:diguanylate cyclase response regulator [Kangiella profundi]|uniref:diguanylate cyclase n=1 Tax=Kangiella profundi TaxID=1561924 RepID=A0A2K9ABF6_9GAMM|nr:response regulator [Kangiella profundi]AUD78747.1 diguanylate cyclase response regulator [Kangiella profundi]GGE89716.1 diguanylate cyclase [Kangiella profundi]
MKNILVVDDSKFFCALIEKKITESLDYQVMSVGTYASAEALLDVLDIEQIDACLVDFRLPDAPEGEIVQLLAKKRIPTIVLISDITAEIRNYIWKFRIVDYVIKSDNYVTEYIIETLQRLQINPSIKIALADDSKTSLRIMSTLLSVHKYQTLQFNDPLVLIEHLKQHRDIKLVITDYDMPAMNGYDLTKNIRRLYSKQELAIIGMSARDDVLMSANFLKYGADDFIIKQSFLAEEFYLRVAVNTSRVIEYEKLTTAATKDYLTGLNNRRHFYELVEVMHSSAYRHSTPVACALVDIDHFKQVNDTYGHQVGDAVLTKIAQILQSSVRKSDVVARFGGEEFCMYMVGINRENSQIFFDKLLKRIEGTVIDVDGLEISVTVSIGVNINHHHVLDSMIEIADKCLYDAKETGRNKVVITPEEPGKA